MIPTAYQLRMRRALDAIGPALDETTFILRKSLAWEIVQQFVNASIGSRSFEINDRGSVVESQQAEYMADLNAPLVGTEFAATVASWNSMDAGRFLCSEIEPPNFDPATYYERVVRAGIDKEPTSGGNPSNVSISVTVNPGANDSEALREAMVSAVRTGFMQSMESAAAKNQV